MQLDDLSAELDLSRFKQHETGDTMVERSTVELPIRVRGYVNTPVSMRNGFLICCRGPVLLAVADRYFRQR